jgi:hypothetical protein
MLGVEILCILDVNRIAENQMLEEDALSYLIGGARCISLKWSVQKIDRTAVLIGVRADFLRYPGANSMLLPYYVSKLCLLRSFN